MLKEAILDIIITFEQETWYFDDNDKLSSDMECIYLIERKIKDIDEKDIRKSDYEKLLAMIGIIRFKYGYQSIIISSISELEGLKKIIDNISLNSGDIVKQYNEILNVYENYINKIKNIDFIKNNYKNVSGEQGLYLAVESIKSLINNGDYRQFLNPNKIGELLIDCIKLNTGRVSDETLSKKYEGVLRQIWERSLSNEVGEKGEYRILFSTISGGRLSVQARMLLNRPDQSSCSMLSSSFGAMYGSRKIGFIYPKTSKMIIASAYGLNSNVFGKGSVNKEKGTTFVTPEALEKVGKERALENGEDVNSSNCYSEILVADSKPCGIAIFGFGAKDLNIDYQEVEKFASSINLPIYYRDIMQDKSNLSEDDKYYIAFHSLMSYFGISGDDYFFLNLKLAENNDYSKICDIVRSHKEQLTDIFFTLKNKGNLSKENMCEAIGNIADLSDINIFGLVDESREYMQ